MTVIIGDGDVSVNDGSDAIDMLVMIVIIGDGDVWLWDIHNGEYNIW